MNPLKQADKILRLPVVQNRTGKSRSSIYLDILNGRFPKSIRLGKRSIGWLESEIDEWIQQRIKDSRGR